MHPTLRSRARNVFGVQLYKNNARTLLSRILSVVNSDWLQHARSVRGVYEWWVNLLHYLLTYFMIHQRSSGVSGNFSEGGKVKLTFRIFSRCEIYFFPVEIFHFGTPEQFSVVSKSEKQKKCPLRSFILLPLPFLVSHFPFPYFLHHFPFSLCLYFPGM